MNIKRIISKLASPPLEVTEQASSKEMFDLLDFADEIREWHRQTTAALKMFESGSPGHDRAIQEMVCIENKLLYKVEELYVKFGFLFD